MLTFNPVADAYVYSASVSSNYGSLPYLRTDASPLLYSYLRFDVEGIGGDISSATLLIYAETGSSGGQTISSVADNTWDELAITYNTAPAIGSELLPLLPNSFASGTWISADVTSLVTGNGLVSFALTSTNNTAVRFTSREGTAANVPQLIINQTVPVPPTDTATPSDTPTDLPTATSTATPTLGYNPVADAYVDLQSSSTNFGGSAVLETGATPLINSYLRFDVEGVTGPISSATLLIYGNTDSSGGQSVSSVADNTWDELTITYDTAPAIGSELLPVVPSSYVGGTVLSVDVTSLVSGNGLVSFALTSTNSIAASFASRESSNPPELIVNVGSGGA